MTDDTPIFALLRRKKIEWTRGVGGLTQSEVDETNAVLADWKARNGLDLAAPAPPVSETKPGGAGQPPIPGNALRPSPAAYAIIKEFEGYEKRQPDGSVKAYPDPASGGDPWTIGFGSTGPDVRPGTHWTRAQAEARLESDVNKFASGVAVALGAAPTSQSEFDSLVSFSYNVGLQALRESTLFRLHKDGDKAGAKAQFARWNKAAGKIMAGLTRRRAAEAALYGGRA